MCLMCPLCPLSSLSPLTPLSPVANPPASGAFFFYLPWVRILLSVHATNNSVNNSATAAAALDTTLKMCNGQSGAIKEEVCSHQTTKTMQSV